MAQRITDKDLQRACDSLNEALNRPKVAWNRIDGHTKANIGNFHIYSAYGSVALHCIHNEGGGVVTIFGLTTKRELHSQIYAMLAGIHTERDKNG